MYLFKWSCVIGFVFALQANLPNEAGISLVPRSDQSSSQEVVVQERGSEEDPQLLLEEKLRLINLLQRFA
jgi:hypothetical protein